MRGLLPALALMAAVNGSAQEDWPGDLSGMGSMVRQQAKTLGGPKSAAQKFGQKCSDASTNLQFNNLGSITYDRDQGDIGSCHVFSSIAVLEAALYRKTKIRHRLSEADLFLNSTVNDPNFYQPFVSRLRAEVETRDFDVAPQVQEGAWPSHDIEFALAHGVAKGSGKDWKAFSERYREYKHELHEKMFKCKLDLAYPLSADSSLAMEEQYAARDEAVKGLCKSPQAALKKFNPEPAATQERLLGGPAKAQQYLESRQENHGLLGDLTHVEFAQGKPGWPDAKSLPDVLAQYLCSGIPVVVGMAMPGGGGHAIVLREFSGELFCSRNSWGDGNDICFDANDIRNRLWSFDVVLTPDEVAAITGTY